MHMSLLDEEIKIEIRNKINSYICNSLLSGKKLTIEEFSNLKELINKYDIEETDDELYNNLRKIIIYSNNNSRYDKYIEYIQRGVSDLNESETLEYLKIILNNLCYYMDNKLLEEIICHYLSFPTSREELIELINQYKNLLQNYNYLLNIINNNYNDLLFNILIALENKDMDKFVKLVDKFYKVDIDNNINTINISLLKKLMKAINNEELIYKIDNKLFYNKKRLLLEKIYALLSKEQKELLVKEDIKKGKIILNSKFSSRRGNIIFDNLDIVDGKNIITINDIDTEDCDSAFSITKIEDMYMLDIYLSDVPSFLMKNNDIRQVAYDRATSIYIKRNGKNKYYIDMIPPFLSHKNLALEQGYSKNLIRFSFIFGFNGELYSSNVTRVKTKVSRNLKYHEALNLLNSNENIGMEQNNIKYLQELLCVLKNNNTDKLITCLNQNNIYDIMSLLELIINYYIGSESEYAIYKENGIYTLNSTLKNAYSFEPLKKYVCDINLAFFLQQKGIVNYPEKKLYIIQDNIDEIICHLNDRELIADFVSNNGDFSRKYLM